MITPFVLESYLLSLAKLGISDANVALVRSLIGEKNKGFEPSSKSVPSIFRSLKVPGEPMPMGSKLELAGALTAEPDPDVAAHFTKCGEFPISWQKADGTVIGQRHRPDALRLHRISSTDTPARLDQLVYFVEFKDSGWLNEKIRSGDQRFSRDGNTKRYRCLAAEKAAKEFYGIGYVIVTEKDLDPVVVNNIDFILDYCRANVPEVPAAIAAKTVEAVAVKQGLSLPELLTQAEGLTPDRFFTLMVGGRVFVRLNECQLDRLSDVRVFTDAASADAFDAMMKADVHTNGVVGRVPTLTPGEVLIIDGKELRVVIVGETMIECTDQNGTATSIKREHFSLLIRQRKVSSLGVPTDHAERAREVLRRTPPKKLQAAIHRYGPLEPYVESRKRRAKDAATRLSSRDRFWLRKARAAKIEFGIGFIGCIDNTDKRGRRGSRLTEEAETLVTSSIEETYITDRASAMTAAYGTYRNLCKTKSQPPVSLKTFRDRVRKYAKDELIRRREGAMAGASHEAPVEGEALVDGVGRFFMQVGHMDEFVLDLALIFPELGAAIGQAWVIALLDGFSRTVLALFVTFDAPSYITTMMALRECVRRWKRLPGAVGMDSGPGFKNVSLDLFLGFYDIRPMWRPKGKARWGAQIERKGGTLNQRISSELPGATKIINKHRRVSKSHHPDRLAVYGLRDADNIVREWCYEEYDTLPHRGLHGKTPKEVRMLSIAEHGAREHLEIEFDSVFQILSLPAPDADGTAKVQPHDGVQVDNIYYWHKDFHLSENVGSRVPLRWDPCDITHVYVFVGGQWQECHCRGLLRLKRLSREELCLASMEIRRGRKGYGRKYSEILERVQKFLDARRKTPEELKELLRAKESARQLIAGMSGPILDDDEPDANTSEAQPKAPIPGLPGAAAASSSYGSLES